MARISPDVFRKGIYKEAERYKSYTVEKDEDADEEYPEAERFESEACEQVALDLSLSVDIFSSKNIGFSTTATTTSLDVPMKVRTTTTATDKCPCASSPYDMSKKKPWGNARSEV